jgi:ribosome-associated protein
MTDKQTDRLALVTHALESLKAKHITQLNVSALTSVADHMIIASGTSGRHLKALADKVVEVFKASGEPPLGVEGQSGGEWVLVDLGDILVHIMLPAVREYYDLEQLWRVNPEGAQQKRPSAKQAASSPPSTRQGDA